MNSSRNTSMITRLAIYPVTICLCLPFLVSSCSEEGLNEFVEAKMKPSAPIVIYTDTKKGTGDDAEDITAPWFIAGFEIKNKHPDYTLVIPSVQLDYEGYYGSTKFEGETQLTADDICSDIDGASRSLYATVEPTRSTAATPIIDVTFYGDINCDGVNDGISDNESVFFHGLPAPSDDDQRINAYRIKATFNGYYRDDNNDIVGNIELIQYYTTQ